MEEKEYYSAKEISQRSNMTSRNVRKIISKLSNDSNNDLIRKNNINHWEVHQLMLPNFKRKRTKKDTYYALTIDPCFNYSEKEIDEIMSFIYSEMKDCELEINYVIEKKKANNQNHLHCYINSTQKRKLLKLIRLSFSRTSYKESTIFDIKGWKSYIIKDGNEIKTLKKKN